MTEAQIQYECVKWLRNTHLETYGLFYEVNNNPANKRQGGIRKSMGMVPGVSDCCFHWKSKTYFIEFKDAKGRQQPIQKEWQKIVESHGFEYHIVRSLTQFQTIINGLLN